MASEKTNPKKDKPIKYADKSAGQPELVTLFNELKKIIAPFVKGNMQSKSDKGQFHLWSNKPVEIAGRKRDALYFASLLVQKGYVGFYFMPVYANPVTKNKLKPALLKCLKGKACFHIKKLDEELRVEINEALQTGYDAYVKNGWV